MMDSKDVKILNNELKCSECCQLFNKPKYLPCYHTYCELCLEKMQIQSKVACPQCKREANVPPGGVKDFDTNILISHLVEEFIIKCKVEGEIEIKCDECSEKDIVVSFCSDCANFLCKICNEHHKRSVMSRDHGIVLLTELRSKRDTPMKLKAKIPVCSKHKNELNYHCESCDELACHTCVMKKHNGHVYDTVKNVVGKHRQQLKETTDSIEEMIRGLSNTNDNVDKMAKKIRQKGDEVNERIDQYYDGVIQKVIEQKEQLKQQLQQKVTEKLNAAMRKLNEVECVQTQMLSLKELSDAAEKSSDHEVLSVKKQLVCSTQQISKKLNVLHVPRRLTTVEFVPTFKGLQQLGFLCSTATPDPQNCVAVGIPKYTIKGKQTEITIVTKDENGDDCFREENKVSVHLEGAIDTTMIRDETCCYTYMASFVPQQVGEMKLSVFINKKQIKASPFTVTVIDYTSLHKPNEIVGMTGKPWGVAFSKSDMWAVANNSNDCVCIFDGKNEPVRKFGCKGSEHSQFNGPAGVAFDSDDHLYVAEYFNDRVQKFTIDGKYLLMFGGKGHEEGNLKDPRGLVVHDNKVYVTENGNKRISVFLTNGKFCFTIGSGQLGSPRDVAINAESQLLVLDYAHHCIYTFTLDGNFVSKIAKYGVYRGHLSYPYGVTVGLHGYIIVADTDNHRISIFDKEGKYVHCFGSYGSGFGQFQQPYGIAVSANGNIYVSDKENKRIQIFSC